jgi:hypothetical protein
MLVHVGTNMISSLIFLPCWLQSIYVFMDLLSFDNRLMDFLFGLNKIHGSLILYFNCILGEPMPTDSVVRVWSIRPEVVFV